MELILKEEKDDPILNAISDAKKPDLNEIKREPNNSKLEIKRKFNFNCVMYHIMNILINIHIQKNPKIYPAVVILIKFKSPPKWTSMV